LVTENSITEEEAIEEANSYDMDGEIIAEYYCYNIGEGESGVDEYFTEDELKDAFEGAQDGDVSFEKFCESYGHSAEVYDQGSYKFTID